MKERFKALRKELKLSQGKMAELFGFGSYQRISEYENGKQAISGTAKAFYKFLKFVNEKAPVIVKDFLKKK